MFTSTIIYLTCFITVANGLGRQLSITKQVKDAYEQGKMSDLFRNTINSKTMVMFTKSKCSLSLAAKNLMNQKHPQQEYFYYDTDIQHLGSKFTRESTKATGSNIFPDIFICGKYIGGFSELEAMQKNGYLASKLRSCPNISKRHT